MTLSLSLSGLELSPASLVRSLWFEHWQFTYALYQRIDFELQWRLFCVFVSPFSSNLILEPKFLLLYEVSSFRKGKFQLKLQFSCQNELFEGYLCCDLPDLVIMDVGFLEGFYFHFCGGKALSHFLVTEKFRGLSLFSLFWCLLVMSNE